MQQNECVLAERGFIPAKRVAEIFGVHEGTLSNWRAQGKGPRWFKLFRRAYYKRDDLDAFIEAQARGASAVAPLHTAA